MGIRSVVRDFTIASCLACSVAGANACSTESNANGDGSPDAAGTPERDGATSNIDAGDSASDVGAGADGGGTDGSTTDGSTTDGSTTDGSTTDGSIADADASSPV